MSKVNESLYVFEGANYVKPEVEIYMGRKWVLYGRANEFFGYIIDRYNGSPTNEAIINVYCELLYGQGIVVNGEEEIYEDLAKLFPQREQRKCLKDFKVFGQYAMQYLKGTGTDKVAKIMHVPMDKLGMGDMERGEKTNVWYCDDWSNTTKYTPTEYKIFKGKMTEAVMIKLVQPYQPGNVWFNDPDYLAALPYAELEEEMANYYINYIKNDMSNGEIINFNNGQANTPEQKDKIEAIVKKKFTGSSNAGKIILSFNDGKEAETTMQSRETTEAHSQWLALTNEARQQLIASHGAYPNLFGIQTTNGLSNNADELDVQSRLLQDYQINPKQEIFIDELASVLELNGLETDLEFLPLRDTYKSVEAKEKEVVDDAVDEEIELAGFDPNQKRAKDGKWTVNDIKYATKYEWEKEDAIKEFYEETKILDEQYDNDDIDWEDYEKEKKRILMSKLQDYFGGKYTTVEIQDGNYWVELRISDHPQSSNRGWSNFSFIVGDSGANDISISYNDNIEDAIAFIKKTIQDNWESILQLSKLHLSSKFSASSLIELGEVIGDDWEVLDDRRCDEITLTEMQLNTVFEFASVPKTDGREKSDQDTSLFKIRYRYAGSTEGECEFCKKVLAANKVYRAEDLNDDFKYNSDFAPSGDDAYNIWNYKGGVNCQHWWERVIFLKKGNKKISVNDARKMILKLEPEDRKDAKWETNDPKVAKVAEKKNNYWSLKPNYRNSGITPTKNG